MKKSILFIVGGVVILILVAIWGYLFFFGTPQSSDEFFADLGLSGEVDTSYVPPPQEATTTTPVVNMERPKLRQLTTKPIAGYTEVIRSTSTPALMYYVEKGTGHVYTINIETGEENRVSQTTVAQAEHAVISSDGSFAAITSFSNNKNKPLFVGAFGTTTLAADSMNLTEVFAGAAQDVTVTNDEVLYTTVGAAGLVGTAYDLDTDTTSTMFTFPLTDDLPIGGVE